MRIQTYKVISHDGLNIYVRRMANTFEYLFCKEGNIFTETVKMRPSLIRTLLFPFGLVKRYSDAQVVGIVRHMQALAVQRIETLKNKKTK